MRNARISRRLSPNRRRWVLIRLTRAKSPKKTAPKTMLRRTILRASIDQMNFTDSDLPYIFMFLNFCSWSLNILYLNERLFYSLSEMQLEKFLELKMTDFPYFLLFFPPFVPKISRRLTCLMLPLSFSGRIAVCHIDTIYRCSSVLLRKIFVLYAYINDTFFSRLLLQLDINMLVRGRPRAFHNRPLQTSTGLQTRILKRMRALFGI